MSRIAFLGAGNMAAAMVEGLLEQGDFSADNIVCMSGSGGTAAALSAKTGITLARSPETLLAAAGTLVVAFKPQHLAAADSRFGALTAGKLVISVLAGKRLARLAQVFPQARNLVRAMPNTPAQIGAGMSGWCSLHPLDTPDRTTVEKLLGALGRHVEIPETQMDALTALSGCGPAYFFEFAAALRDAEPAQRAHDRIEPVALVHQQGPRRLVQGHGPIGESDSALPEHRRGDGHHHHQQREQQFPAAVFQMGRHAHSWKT